MSKLAVDVWQFRNRSFDIAIHDNNEDSILRKVFDGYGPNNKYLCIYCITTDIGNLNYHQYSYTTTSEYPASDIYCPDKLDNEAKIEVIISCMHLLERCYKSPERDLYNYLITKFEEELFNFE